MNILTFTLNVATGSIIAISGMSPQVRDLVQVHKVAPGVIQIPILESFDCLCQSQSSGANCFYDPLAIVPPPPNFFNRFSPNSPKAKPIPGWVLQVLKEDRALRPTTGTMVFICKIKSQYATYQ